MFCGYVISVSFALEIRYGVNKLDGIIGMVSIGWVCVLLIITIIYFILLIK